jgi:hypothetical protein
MRIKSQEPGVKKNIDMMLNSSKRTKSERFDLLLSANRAVSTSILILGSCILTPYSCKKLTIAPGSLPLAMVNLVFIKMAGRPVYIFSFIEVTPTSLNARVIFSMASSICAKV